MTRIETRLAILTLMITGLYIVGATGAPAIWLLLRIAAKVGALS